MSVASSLVASCGLRICDLESLQRRLNRAGTVAELFAITAAEAIARSSRGRAIVLELADGCLKAEVTAPLVDPASDELRRRVIARPIELRPGTLEAFLAHGSRPSERSWPSAVAGPLALDDPTIVPILVDERTIAMIVADGIAEDSAGPADVAILAHLVGLCVVNLVLRSRVREIAQELRCMTTSANALVQEALSAPTALPRDYGQGPVFVYPATAAPARRDGLLTDREDEVMRLVAAGLSNGQIAKQLNLSVETVKGHVVRLLRKLEASNRVDAVVRYLQHSPAPSAG